MGVGESVLRRWVQQLTAERQGVTPKGKAMTPEQQRVQELEERCRRLEMEKSILKKATALLMSDDWKRTRYYEHRQRIQQVDAERVALRAWVNELFNKSRSSAGSRTIQGLLNDQGVGIGRFKVRRLMSELGLVCKQPGPHAYKRATLERLDIPNRLDREFDVAQSDQVWCGDITYIWTGQRWSYLAVVLDLCARRVVGWAMSDAADADLVVQALDHAWEQRGRPEGIIFHSDQGSQYVSRKFRQRLWRYRMVQSMSRRGNCWDTQSTIRLERRPDLTRAGIG